jgi:serine phosphatase RsbU (regulator of sigma subunit)
MSLAEESTSKRTEEALAKLAARLRAAEESLRAVSAEREALQQALADIQQQHRVASERLRSDLALAREIQRGLLLEPAPDWKDLELLCHSRPALEIGGDFYAHRATGNARVLLSKYVLAVGDASGKGVSAALLMASVLSRFDASFAHHLGPAERLARLDKEMMPFTKPRRQSCALCCVEIVGINTVRPVMRTANAGCIPPYIKYGDGSVEWIEIGGPPLGQGLGARSGYAEIATPLAKGDMIVLTSDGVVEARDASDELFGFERLEAAIAGGPPASPRAMVDHLRSELEAFLGDLDPHDDVTIAVVRL